VRFAGWHVITAWILAIFNFLAWCAYAGYMVQSGENWSGPIMGLAIGWLIIYGIIWFGTLIIAIWITSEWAD